MKGIGHVENRQHRWKDNISMDLREIRWKVWTGFISLRIGISGALVITAMDLHVP
jgi:hypothetical protein